MNQVGSLGSALFVGTKSPNYDHGLDDPVVHGSDAQEVRAGSTKYVTGYGFRGSLDFPQYSSERIEDHDVRYCFRG